MTNTKALFASVTFVLVVLLLSWASRDFSSGAQHQAEPVLGGQSIIARERPSVESLRSANATGSVALDSLPRAYEAMAVVTLNKGSDNSGSHMDPNDPGTWAEIDIGRLNVGEQMDPNDPSTWSESDVGRLNVGESMDPNDPSTWRESDIGRLNVGEPMDPNDPSTWGTGPQVRINAGPPMDPNDFSTWGD